MRTVVRFALALVLGVVTVAPGVSAQYFPPCDSCASCTALLAADHARGELVADLDARGISPCLVIRGSEAQLNARGHTLRAGAVGARLEGRGARLRNLRVVGGGTGVVLAAPDAATLYHVTVEGASVGISVEASPGARIVRSEVHGGAVGIGLGPVTAGRCLPGATVRSPAAAVLRCRVEGADIGIAACEAIPVLAGNTVTDNGVGVLLGAPAPASPGVPGANAPFDPCACAPDLTEVRAGTTLLYSSGCSGCEVHEGWLPGLRARGADIRVRETGPGSADAGQRYDDFAGRCAPELTDTLGIPGSVPNYGCMATGIAWKVRTDDTRYVTEATVDGPDDVARFASVCAAAAASRYGSPVCVRHALWENRLCGNRTADLHAEGAVARAGAGQGRGADDTCDTAEGWTEGGHPGCAHRCDPAQAPAAVVTEAPAAVITEVPARRAPAGDAATDWGPLAWLATVAAVLGAGALALGRFGRRK